MGVNKSHCFKMKVLFISTFVYLLFVNPASLNPIPLADDENMVEVIPETIEKLNSLKSFSSTPLEIVTPVYNGNKSKMTQEKIRNIPISEENIHTMTPEMIEEITKQKDNEKVSYEQISI